MTAQIHYGGTHWWNNDLLIEQVIECAVPIFELEYPGCEALFLFDNSRGHRKWVDDSLTHVNEMNLGPGGGQPKMRDTIYPEGPKKGQVQPLVQEDGTAKGIRAILEERGKWEKKMRLACPRPKPPPPPPSPVEAV